MSERDRPPGAGRTIPRAAGRPIGVGVQLPEVEREVRWPELRAIARLAEQAGFDSIWVGDHLLYRYATRRAPRTVGGVDDARRPSPRPPIGSRSGPLVAASAFHAPFMLAKQAATVDEVSGGRLVLGLGAGWNDMEFAALGAPFDHRISRFEEAFTVVRTLLADGRDRLRRHATSRPATPSCCRGRRGRAARCC